MVTPSLRLLRPLGAGGMGSVWIARHLGLDANVVVKFMSEELATNGQALERFRREAAAAADVRSPHVVQTFDYGLSADGVPYIAMELLEGESLRQRLDRERRLVPRDVITIVAHCAKALSRAHDRGVVHRDIKPDNIFLTDGGDGEVFAKVLDFGIAKSSAANHVATSTGAVLGTPYYMSPEQVLGAKGVDARTDLWASVPSTARRSARSRSPSARERRRCRRSSSPHCPRRSTRGSHGHALVIRWPVSSTRKRWPTRWLPLWRARRRQLLATTSTRSTTRCPPTPWAAWGSPRRSHRDARHGGQSAQSRHCLVSPGALCGS
jgi:serine/threonine protein kinase